MNTPTSLNEVLHFIGVVNCYRNMCPRRSHMLSPLTKITTNKSKCKFTKIKQDAFNEINQIVAHDTLLTYTYFNETFKIHTDDSKFQLGVVISHKGKSIAF